MSINSSMEESAPETAYLKQSCLDYVWIPNKQWNDLAKQGGFTIFVEGKGCKLTDIDGNTWLDGYAGLMLANVGYGHKEIADAAHAQMYKLNFFPDHQISIPTIKLAAKLAEITPGTLSRSFFVNSGSESIEAAVKIAKKYQRNAGFPNRYKVISRKGGYHGGSYLTMTLGVTPDANGWIDYVPLVPGVVHIAQPYCYQCEFGLEYPNCNLECARDLERVIKFESPELVAAVVMETVSHPPGVIVPPAEYWPMIRSICNKYGVLLINDEVVCAFGRTGKMFGVEHWDIVPDIMCVAKGLSSGYLPIGSAIVRKEVFDKFIGGAKETFRHSCTFSGHPVTCAAALANIDIIEKEDLVENSATMGEHLKNGLKELSKHPIVGDVRGIGLMCAVEFVKDKKTKQPFSAEDGLRRKILQKFNEVRFIARVGVSHIKIMPPLCISKGEVEEIVTIIEKAITEVEREMPIG